MIRIKRITMVEMYRSSTAANHNTSGKKSLNVCCCFKEFLPLFPNGVYNSHTPFVIFYVDMTMFHWR